MTTHTKHAKIAIHHCVVIVTFIVNGVTILKSFMMGYRVIGYVRCVHFAEVYQGCTYCHEGEKQIDPPV